MSTQSVTFPGEEEAGYEAVAFAIGVGCVPATDSTQLASAAENTETKVVMRHISASSVDEILDTFEPIQGEEGVGIPRPTEMLPQSTPQPVHDLKELERLAGERQGELRRNRDRSGEEVMDDVRNSSLAL